MAGLSFSCISLQHEGALGGLCDGTRQKGTYSAPSAPSFLPSTMSLTQSGRGSEPITVVGKSSGLGREPAAPDA